MPASRTIERRLNDARALAASLETNAEAAADGVRAFLAPHLQDGETLDADTLRLVLELARRAALASADALQQAEAAHTTELGEDDDARAARDASTEQAYDSLRRFKNAARNAYGADFLKSLPVAGNTPRRASALLQQYDLLLKRLQNADLFPPQDDPFSPTLAAAEVRDTLQPIRDDLAARLDAVGTDTRETEQALLAKHEAIEAYETTEDAAEALANGFYTAAGLHAEADRL